MADLNLAWRAIMALASGNAGFDVVRTLEDLGELIYDSTVVLPEGQAVGSATTLWTGTNHGAAGVSASIFSFAALLVDPEEALATALPVDVQLFTTLLGTGTVLNWTHRQTREVPLLLASPLAAGHQGTASTALTNVSGATPDVISRIDARNPATAVGDGSNDVTVRLIVIA